MVISASEDGGNPVAIGFRAKKSNGKYRYFWLYRVKFGIPSTSLATKGDSITFSTPTIEGTDAAQQSDSGDKLMKSENMEMALDEIVWLITLLCNQGIQIHNLKNEDKKPLLTEETVELLTSPGELAEYKDAITEAMMKGTKRNIVSEDNSKNAVTAE